MRVDGYPHSAIAREVDTLRKRGAPFRAPLYHCTNSNALPSIAEHGILSSLEAARRGIKLKSGEITTPDGALFHHGKEGLRDIYVTDWTCAAYDGYAFTEEFGGHAVVLGIRNRLTNGYRAEDLAIGPQVPTNDILCVTAPYDTLAETRVWSAEHCNPGTLVMSLEAVSIITRSALAEGLNSK